jgi:hypothetical protein
MLPSRPGSSTGSCTKLDRRTKNLDARSRDQLLQHPGRIDTQGPRDSNELDDIETAVARLIFGNKGLRLADPVGEILLAEASRLASFPKEGAELFLTLGMDGFSHALVAEAVERMGRSMQNSDIPK